MGSKILDDDTLEEDLEEDQQSFLLKLGKIFLVLALVMGLIYFSGLREYFFFSQTSSNIEIQPLEPIVDAKIISLPYSVIIVRGPRFGSQRTEKEVASLILNSSSILRQAGIELVKKEVVAKKFNHKEILAVLNGDFSSLVLDSEVLNIILLKNLGGLNGVAFPNSKVVMVADYTAGKDFRTLSHEIGHILGLDHSKDPYRLMSQGGIGNALTIEEVIKMREIFNEQF